MTDATSSDWVSPAPRARAKVRPVPKRKPMGGPILITDAITPVAGETLLGLLMKRMQDASNDPAG